MTSEKVFKYLQKDDLCIRPNDDIVFRYDENKEGIGIYHKTFQEDDGTFSVEITWYCQAKEIFSSNNIINYISDKELFVTNYNQRIPADSIFYMPQILPLKDFIGKEWKESYNFFKRYSCLEAKRKNFWQFLIKKCQACDLPFDEEISPFRCEVCGVLLHSICSTKAGEDKLCKNCYEIRG